MGLPSFEKPVPLVALGTFYQAYRKDLIWMRMHRTPLLASVVAIAGLCLALLPAPARAQGATDDRKVTLNLKDIPLRSAIDALFAGSGLQYSVDPTVQNVPVNLSIRDIGLQSALRLLIRQAAVAQPGLTFSKDGDIFVVKIRQAAPQSATPMEDAPPEYQPDAAEFNWERIPIQFNNVAVFTLAFGGRMLPTEDQVIMSSQGGQGGGMGGMGGGMMGGMGGMGGGMGGGMMGGMGGGGFGGGGMGGFGGGGMGGRRF